MHKNRSFRERVLRIAAAGVMIVLVLANIVSWGLALVLAVAAVMLVGTGLSGFCPVYALFGIHKEVSDEAAH